MADSGPSRHVALRWPSVADGALRTRLDPQLAPPRSRLTRGNHQVGTLKKGLLRPRPSAIIMLSPAAGFLIAAPFSSRLSRYTLGPLSETITLACCVTLPTMALPPS
jgi:hypothetical protein